MCETPSLPAMSFMLKSHSIQQSWLIDNHHSKSEFASTQAFHADRAALAATILARQLESQQIRGVAQPAQLMLEQSPAQSTDRPPDGLDPDAAAQQASPAASRLCRINAEPSTELMWQPDEQLTSSAAQHDEPSQNKQQLSPLEPHPQLHQGLGFMHKEEEEAQQRSPPDTAAAAPLLCTVQRQGELKDSQERSPADGRQSRSELPTVTDARVNNMELRSASSSPDVHRHSPEPARPRPVAKSIQHQTRDVSEPARGSLDLLTEPSHGQQINTEDRQPSIAHESPLATSLHDDAMVPQAQISQGLHDFLATEQCVSGRSTLLRLNHLPAPQADSAVSSPHSASSRQMPLRTSAHGQGHHDSEAWRGRASAQQANPKARIWSRQQLGYEDSSEAIKEDAGTVSHQGTDLEGYAGPSELVSQGPHPEGQQESMLAGARVDGRHPDQGTDSHICTSCQQAHAVLLLFATRILLKTTVFRLAAWHGAAHKIGKVTLGKFQSHPESLFSHGPLTCPTCLFYMVCREQSTRGHTVIWHVPCDPRVAPGRLHELHCYSPTPQAA